MRKNELATRQPFSTSFTKKLAEKLSVMYVLIYHKIGFYAFKKFDSRMRIRSFPKNLILASSGPANGTAMMKKERRTSDLYTDNNRQL